MTRPAVNDISPLPGRTQIWVIYGDKPPQWDTNLDAWPQGGIYEEYPDNIKQDMTYDNIPLSMLRLLYNGAPTELTLQDAHANPETGIFVLYQVPNTNHPLYKWDVPRVLPFKLHQFIPECYIFVGISTSDPRYTPQATQTTDSGDVTVPAVMGFNRSDYKSVAEIRSSSNIYFTNRSIVYGMC
jgi:hypothetical protein